MYAALIPSAGSGTRMKLGYNKNLFKLDHQLLIEKTVSCFLNDKDCKQVVLIVSKEDEKQMEKIFANLPIQIVVGGKTRQESVYLGLQHITQDFVLIHDGARPNLSQVLIDQVKSKLQMGVGVIPVVAVKDTIKVVENGYVKETLKRDTLFQVQTPQGFNTKQLLQVHQDACLNHIEATDDASLYEISGLPVCVVEGDYLNIKVTTIEDLKQINR